MPKKVCFHCASAAAAKQGNFCSDELSRNRGLVYNTDYRFDKRAVLRQRDGLEPIFFANPSALIECEVKAPDSAGFDTRA